jgi:hypothetical protein
MVFNMNENYNKKSPTTFNGLPQRLSVVWALLVSDGRTDGHDDIIVSNFIFETYPNINTALLNMSRALLAGTAVPKIASAVC